jgi:hypothetical protein
MRKLQIEDLNRQAKDYEREATRRNIRSTEDFTNRGLDGSSIETDERAYLKAKDDSFYQGLQNQKKAVDLNKTRKGEKLGMALGQASTGMAGLASLNWGGGGEGGPNTNDSSAWYNNTGGAGGNQYGGVAVNRYPYGGTNRTYQVKYKY